MPDHIAIGKIDPADIKTARPHARDGRFGDLAGFHPRPLLKADALIGGDVEVLFPRRVNIAGAVAIPEVGDMAELLGFTAGKLPQLALDEILTQRVINFWWGDEVPLRDLEITIVLHHPRIKNLWLTLPIKIRQVRIAKRPGDLYGTIATEIKADDAVAVVNRSDRFAMAVGNDKLGEKLIR